MKRPDQLTRILIITTLVLIAACAPVVAPTPTATHAPTALPTAAPTIARTGDTPIALPVSAVALPANYRTDFLHYVTVDRPDATVRDLYINPAAVAELRRTRRLPDDAIVVIEAYQAQLDTNGDAILDAEGRYLKAEPMAMIHVAHKRSDWAEADFPGAARSGDWNFGSFQFATGAPFAENLSACFNCHQATARSDFVYSASQLVQYALSDTTQYFFCELRRRTPCQ